MARTHYFQRIQQLIRVAEHCARTDQPAAETLQRLRSQSAP